MPSAFDRLFAAYCRACAYVVALIPVAAVASLIGMCAVDWARFGPREFFQPIVLTIGFTVAVAAASALVGGSIGIGAAFLSHELAPAGIRKSVDSAIALLRAMPAFGFGWLGAAVVAPFVISLMHGAVGAFAAAVILLSIVETPASATLAIRALRRVPQRVRHAAVAAGATRLQTLTLVLMPALRRRIASAYVACFGRACCEAVALTLLFIALAKSSIPAANTMASMAFQLQSGLASGGPGDGIALAIAAIAFACALWVDRDYRGRQWM